MFSFWKKRKAEPAGAPVEAPSPAPAAAPAPVTAPAPTPNAAPVAAPVAPALPVAAPPPAPVPMPAARLPEPPAGEEMVLTPPPAASQEARRGWVQRLRTGLSKTSRNLGTLFVGVKVDEALFEELETALLMADAGVEATEYLLGELRRRVKSERIETSEGVKTALRELLTNLLRPLEKTMELGREQPMVMMIAGVNGAGKTTSIGKLCKHFQSYGQSVLLAAGDTFRAAAREQLTIWGERNNVTVVSQESGDPAAVIFDAVNAARARGIDIVMADTAGRLPTQLHLMEELKKVKRVIAKAMPSAPHESLLVIDANTGQNALAQVKAFDDALNLTGLIVTKLDGTAKGGILAAIARQRPVPVYFIGVGEKVEDLQPFRADEFAEALLG
ncbi:signal recognition particle-docking protein FtsY [Cupriavidus sp. M-11]|uniref:signal recognition particle-docking protein FtsY n=1 Tax=Cupriavidus sp. M-11 TaxID=3233038 RepID=UPI003F910BA4